MKWLDPSFLEDLIWAKRLSPMTFFLFFFYLCHKQTFVCVCLWQSHHDIKLPINVCETQVPKSTLRILERHWGNIEFKSIRILDNRLAFNHSNFGFDGVSKPKLEYTDWGDIRSHNLNIVTMSWHWWANIVHVKCRNLFKFKFIAVINPLMPSGVFNICCPRDCVSRTANVEHTARH